MTRSGVEYLLHGYRLAEPLKMRSRKSLNSPDMRKMILPSMLASQDPQLPGDGAASEVVGLEFEFELKNG